MKRKKTLARVMLALALLLVIVGGVWTVTDYQRRNAALRQQESLIQLANQTTEVSTESQTETQTEPEKEPPYVSPVNFDELRKVNPDIIGWIKVEGTKIDYPIVQTDDNETYLKTDFEGQKSVYGAIYLDYESEPDFSGKHNIIYGHNMKDGCMFKDIVKYKDEAFFKEHQDLVIYTPDREIHLKAMSALYTDAGPIRRKTKFATEESFDAYVEEMTKGCAFAQMPEQKITTLYSFVTCSYEFNDARTILYAYEVSEN